MAKRARLSSPLQTEQIPPVQQKAEWAAMPARFLMQGDRRMEAESYLSSGRAIRLAIEAQPKGWVRVEELANVWQPSRLKGIQVSPEYGTPFLAATQVFDLRPIPRKWLALERTSNHSELLVHDGMILITRSGNVGRATLAHKPHLGVIISDDLLRVEAKQSDQWGWLYAFARSVQARAMMRAAQYGHIIKHLEVGHLNALPIPRLQGDLIKDFNDRVQTVLNNRNHAYSLLVEAEAIFEREIGPLITSESGESGFEVHSSEFRSGRRRLDGFFYSPTVKAIRHHFARQGKTTEPFSGLGFAVWLPTRFKRIPAREGVELLDSSDLFEINPDVTKRIADGDFGDPNSGRVKAGWLLLARSGQVYGLNGTLTIATHAHENKVISDHVIRIAPTESLKIRTGYLYIALSHPTLGRPLVKSLAYGSSIPEIEVADLLKLEVIRLGNKIEDTIADMAEKASGLLAQADLEERIIADKAEEIINKFISRAPSEK